jgi:hypothetical protein
MVAGEALITDGRFTRGPESEIVAAGAAAMHRVWRRAEEQRVIEPPTIFNSAISRSG